MIIRNFLLWCLATLPFPLFAQVGAMQDVKVYALTPPLVIRISDPIPKYFPEQAQAALMVDRSIILAKNSDEFVSFYRVKTEKALADLRAEFSPRSEAQKNLPSIYLSFVIFRDAKGEAVACQTAPPFINDPNVKESELVEKNEAVAKEANDKQNPTPLDIKYMPSIYRKNADGSWCVDFTMANAQLLILLQKTEPKDIQAQIANLGDAP